MIPLNCQLTVAELIALVRKDEERTGSFCVYGTGDSSNANLDSTCYICAHPEITVDYEEIFPAFVVQNSIELWYRDELIQDVFDNALHQNPDVSDETIVDAIKHYNARDCFLDL